MEENSPLYLLEPTSETREIFLRTMYLVFLGGFMTVYCVSLNATLCLVLFLLFPEQGYPLPPYTLAIAGVLLAASEPILLLWKKHLALERIDAQFNGKRCIWEHQTHREWPQVKALIDLYQKNHHNPETQDRLATYAHTHREFYGVIDSIAHAGLSHKLKTWRRTTPPK